MIQAEQYSFAKYMDIDHDNNHEGQCDFILLDQIVFIPFVTVVISYSIVK